MTFETFVPGTLDLAYEGAKAIAAGDKSKGNVLYIYGEHGTGKSHLLHAICNEVSSRLDETKFILVSAKEYTAEFSQAVETKSVPTFVERYREADILLLDDFHLIKGEGILFRFFVDFDQILEGGGQVVVTSRVAPASLSISEHYGSRLLNKLSWYTQPVTEETRVPILHKLAEMEGFELPVESAEAIAGKVKGNAEEMRGTLVRLRAYSELKKEPITLDLVKRAVAEIGPSRAQVTVSLVLEAVSDMLPFTVEQLKSKRRTADLAEARQIAMYLSRKLTDKSLPRIGEALGGRDHTTIMHGVDKITFLLSQGKLPEVAEIEAAIRARAVPARSV